MSMRTLTKQLRYVDLISNGLLVIYTSIVPRLIDKQFFNYRLGGVGFGLVTTLVFAVSYPLFGWGRRSPWKRVGDWSFLKWITCAVLLGTLATLVSVLSWIATRYFSH